MVKIDLRTVEDYFLPSFHIDYEDWSKEMTEICQ